MKKKNIGHIILCIIVAAGPVARGGALVPQFISPPPGASAYFGANQALKSLPNGNFVVVDSYFTNGAVKACGAAFLYDSRGNQISALMGDRDNDTIGENVPVYRNGSSASSAQIIVLPGGNFVLVSPHWHGSVGAVTWGSQYTGWGLGATNYVHETNSLVGPFSFSEGKIVSIVGNDGLNILPNGNFVVYSPYWAGDDGLSANVGAVTWGSGTCATTGRVTSANSVVGDRSNGNYGSDHITVLENSSFVINPGTMPFAKWCSGVAMSTGVVSQANAIGPMTNAAIVALHGANGDFLVCDAAYDANKGAVRWGSGTNGAVGDLSAANSLVGGSAGDRVGWNVDGNTNIAALADGSYVVASPNWGGGKGAVTWCPGGVPTVAAVSAANSLVGDLARDAASRVTNIVDALDGQALYLVPGDQVGSGGVTPVSNGNYVVSSPYWSNLKGAVVFCQAGGTTVGSVSNVAAKLVGATTRATNTMQKVYNTDAVFNTPGDRVGSGGVTVLSNGHYVVSSPVWDKWKGAVTWGSGVSGVSGVVGATNSLVGTLSGATNYYRNGSYNLEVFRFPGDRVGYNMYDNVNPSGITALPNGHYVVCSPTWSNFLGAVTWGNGAGGATGLVGAANSLVGVTSCSPTGSIFNAQYFALSGMLRYSNEADRVGADGIVVLASNRGYVVNSPCWGNWKGAATWGSSTGGLKGALSASNSLVGSTGWVTNSYLSDSGLWGSPGDQVGSAGYVSALNNGNYIVRVPEWNRRMGAVAWGSGLAGTTGAISSANALVGALQWQTNSFFMTNVPGPWGSDTTYVGFKVPGDHVGYDCLLLSNGNYVVISPEWGSMRGAVTWGSGVSGVSGAVGAGNSLVGSATGDVTTVDHVIANSGNWLLSAHATQPGDWLGDGSRHYAMANGGCYSVISSFCNGNTGAVSVCDGVAGTTTGSVTTNNSYIGATATVTDPRYYMVGGALLDSTDDTGSYGFFVVKDGASSRLVILGYAGGSDRGLISNIRSRNVLTTSAEVMGDLLIYGASPDVYVYYGTTNGGTNAAAWLASGGTVVPLGGKAAGTGFTNTLGGLSSSTTYYWTYVASNAAGTVWGNQSGTTPSFSTAGTPAVTNAGASNVNGLSATLNGILTAGQTADIVIYCGTDETCWTFTNNLGSKAQDVAFSCRQGGLALGTNYKFQVYASNTFGTALSGLRSFTNLPYVWINTTNTLFENQTNTCAGLPVIVDGPNALLILSNSATYGALPVYQFGSLLVTNGAAVVGLSQGGMTPCTITNKGVAIQSAGDVVIDGGCSINADGTGFPAAGGPGGMIADWVGGTHGGQGGGNTNAPYGSASAPLTLGSGGATYPGHGGPGGGALKLIVAGNLVVNGRLSAKGQDWIEWAKGGGAGGSLWITGGGTLSGTGEVVTAGGYSYYVSSYGGGGGRLSIDNVTYAFRGTLRGAYLPPVWTTGCGPAGSVYFGPSVRQDFTVYSNQTVVVGGDVPVEFGNLTVYGTLAPSGSYNGAGSNVTIRAETITVAAGGSINADSWGLWGGPGSTNGAGGTHGGAGQGNGMAPYGSATAPTTMGSGGNASYYYPGGGAVKLVVPGRLDVAGVITANGFGGGAGGSVWIDCGALTGGGSIRANGDSSGGGGRIAIYYRDRTSSFAGLPPEGLYMNRETMSSSITVKGGYNTGVDGVEDGSIYIQRIRLSGTILIVK